MKSRKFELPDSEGAVVFSGAVLMHMYRWAQRRFYDREAGGQIFSPAPHVGLVEVSHASGPNPDDRRGRHSILWDVDQANQDRLVHFAEGRHAVGLWHTHPEARPKPSGQDEQTTRQFLDAFSGSMKGFLLVIVGNKGTPPNITVWLARSGVSGQRTHL